MDTEDAILILFIYFIDFVYVCAHMHVCVHVSVCIYIHIYIYIMLWHCVCVLLHAYRYQKTICGHGFSPSVLWVLGIKLRLSCLAASVFTPSHLTGPRKILHF